MYTVVQYVSSIRDGIQLQAVGLVLIALMVRGVESVLRTCKLLCTAKHTLAAPHYRRYVLTNQDANLTCRCSQRVSEITLTRKAERPQVS